MKFLGTTGGKPDSGAGILTSDGSGGIDGKLTENYNGTICRWSLGGSSYTMNPEGTGTMSLTMTRLSGTCGPVTTQAGSVLFEVGKGMAIVRTGSAGVAAGTLSKQ